MLNSAKTRSAIVETESAMPPAIKLTATSKSAWFPPARDHLLRSRSGPCSPGESGQTQDQPEGGPLPSAGAARGMLLARPARRCTVQSRGALPARWGLVRYAPCL
jgi:hypothetical protein